MADDKQTLKKQREEREKLIQGLCEDLRQSHLLNSDSIAFGLKETPNGPALVVRGQFDPKHLKDGWQYSANYLLASDYGQEGLYRMKDGKYEFIPIEHESNKDMVAVYNTPNDVRNGILSVNPHINPEQILIDSTSGRAEIQLVGVIGDIRMPQGLEMNDGMVVDINDYNKSFEIKKVLANETTKEDIVAGSEYSNTKTINQAPQMEDVYDYKENESSAMDNMEITSLLDFNEMRRVYAMYCRDSSGNIVTKTENNNNRSISTTQVTDPYIIAQFEIAEMWVHAYAAAYKLDHNNDGIVCTAEDFNASMATVYACQGKRLSEITEALFHANGGLENVDIVRTVLYFICNPQLVEMFGIALDMSPEEAIAKVNQLSDEYLHDKWDDLVGEFRKEPSMDDEMDNGMEMLRQQNFNNNNNNNNI